MIKKIFRKMTILLASAMLICTCFFNFNLNYIKADTADPGILDNFDSYTEGLGGIIEEVVKRGVRYFAPIWAKKNQDSNHIWLSSLASGVVTVQSMQAISDVIDTTDRATGWVLDGVEWGKTKVQEGWDSLKSQVQNGVADNHTIWLMKKLLGAVGTLDNAYSNIQSAFNDIDLAKESSYFNYYDHAIAGTNEYRAGATSYYSVYNDNAQTFYNTYNNSYETVNNYTYDIENNYYNYYTTENHYHVTNNFNNTYVFNTGASEAYKLYYALPDGSNSYNLTADEIYGIRTDFNVSNYEINYDNPNIVGIYHFNNNSNNILDYNVFNNDVKYLPYSSSNYVDSQLGFDLGLQFTSKYIFSFNQYYKNVKFKMYNSNNNNLSFGDTGDVGKTFNVTDDGKIIISNTVHESYDQLLGINNNAWQQIEFNYISDGFYEYYLNGIKIKNFVIKDSYTLDDFQNNTTATLLSCENKIINNKKCVVLHYRTPSGTETTKTYYGLLNMSLNLGDIIQSFNIVDELIVANQSTNNHGVSFLPFDNNFYYTLPNVDTNNKLLIKSNIEVNTYQFGGIRKNVYDAVRGDVYINLIDGVINSIQQFNGTEWISVDGAVYSDVLGKWVNANGWSIYNGKYEYGDVTANDVDDVNSFTKFFSNAINGLADGISKGFDNVINNLKDIFVDETIAKDGLTLTNDYDIDVDNDISDYLEDVTDIDGEIEFDLDTQLGNDVTAVKTLAQQTMGIFDVISDNDLEIVYIAPLVVLLVRLVI